ncbi:hypothetical protein BRD01_16335 [Halobacteriales archaeon QS_8_65_32]|jgi:uncharacterized membrane protein|nr:MAG: hypothetical protein BRD01_16335 [Halobacteriales archaeon QS_8_65_32]
MRRLLRFALLLAPYAAFVAVCPVIGAAFFVPDVVFGTIGTVGLLAAIIAAVVSLIVIVRTDRTLVDVGRRMNQEHGRLEAAENEH